MKEYSSHIITMSLMRMAMGMSMRVQIWPLFLRMMLCVVLIMREAVARRNGRRRDAYVLLVNH